MKELRVWYIINVPNIPTFIPVKTVEEAKEIIKREIEKQIKDSSITSNVFGLEEKSDDKWCEYYNDEGMDIMEIMKESD